MRFILGLTTGALVTLFVATALNAPTDQLVGRAVHAWAQVRAVTADVAGGAAPSVAAQQPLPPPVPGPLPLDSAEPSAVPAQTQAVEALATQQPASTDEDIRPVAAVSELAVPPEPVFDPLPLASAQPRDEVAARALAEPTRLQRREVVVWGPFHSEASAQGFAGRLAREIDRPFEVRKQGPAQYLVTYMYTEDAQRVALEEEIALVIGAPRT